MKAYKDADEKVWLFRPLDNFKRLNISAKRLAIPELPENYFMEGLKALLEVDSDWIPKNEGSSLIYPSVYFCFRKWFSRLTSRCL